MANPSTPTPKALSPFHQNLDSLMKREVRTLTPSSTVGEAASVMCESGVGSLVVVEGDSPVGILTKTDLVAKVLVPALPHDTPVQGILSEQLVTLEANRPIFDGLLLMIRHDIGHIVVTQQGKLAGIVSERDWLTFQQRHPAAMLRELGNATSIEDLAILRTRILRMVRNLFANEGSARALTALVTEINDRVTKRVIRLCLEAERGTGELELVNFAWMAFGSEGREEQTLSTDQDNGIVFSTPTPERLEEVRNALMRFAARVVDGLDMCGFPRCKGNVMATNPDLCLSLVEWKQKFRGHILAANPEALLWASIQFDFRSIYGKSNLVNALWDFLLEEMQQNKLFLRHLAGQIMQGRPPTNNMGWKFRRWLGLELPAIDLKKQALGPMVAAARILALEAGVRETGTIPRLEAVLEKGLLPPGLAEAAIAAYDHLMLLRVRQQFRQQNAGMEPDNQLIPANLNPLEREFLEDALQTVIDLQDEVFDKYGGIQSV